MQSHCSDAYSHSHSIPLSSLCQTEQAWRAEAMPRFPVAPTLNSYAEIHYEISNNKLNIMRYEDLYRFVMYSTQLHPSSDKQQKSCSPSRPAELQISSHPLELALADPSSEASVIFHANIVHPHIWSTISSTVNVYLCKHEFMMIILLRMY